MPWQADLDQSQLYQQCKIGWTTFNSWLAFWRFKEFNDQKRDEKDVQRVWSDISVYNTINRAEMFCINNITDAVQRSASGKDLFCMSTPVRLGARNKTKIPTRAPYHDEVQQTCHQFGQRWSREKNSNKKKRYSNHGHYCCSHECTNRSQL